MNLIFYLVIQRILEVTSVLLKVPQRSLALKTQQQHKISGIPLAGCLDAVLFFGSRPWRDNSKNLRPLSNRCHYYSQYTLHHHDPPCMSRQSTAISPLVCFLSFFRRQLSVLDPEMASLIRTLSGWHWYLTLKEEQYISLLIWHERNRSVLSPCLDGTKCQSNQRWWKLIALMST